MAEVGMKEFTREQIRKYFEARLPEHHFTSKDEQMAKCPFHQDRTASLSLHMERGVFKCHAGCGEGGLIDFEMKFSSAGKDEAWASIAEITGNRQSFISRGKPEAVYPYRDAMGKLLFEKLRYPGKQFSQRQPDGRGGWSYKLDKGLRKPLYRLPELLVSNYVMVAEGEKDCDNLMAAMKDKGFKFCATTNFDGAGKWRENDAVYFAGRQVVVLADNDEIGRKHADSVAGMLYGIAYGIKVVYFAELPPHGDVSDYLKDHHIDDLLARIKATDPWRPSESTNPLLIQAHKFVNSLPADTDWLVEGLIENGANGVFAADPKSGKSFAAADLAVSLAIGAPWLNFHIPRPVRTAIIAREDNPALTAWRIRHLWNGKTSGHSDLITENLWVNTRAQSKDYKIDVEELHKEMSEELKARQIRFAIFDVFNVLHSADENDNGEMREVLQCLTALQAEAGCQIALVHHFGKGTGSMMHRLRGSTAIAGWVEWMVGISIVDPETKLRRMEFEAKVDNPPEPIHYRIVTDKAAGQARLVLADAPGVNHRREGAAAEKLM
jgi:AAA domain/CHC2 zinc finger